MRAMRGAFFAVVLCLGATAAGAAETSAPLPPGLAAVWRIDGRKLDAHDSAWSLAAFSTDGTLVGISDESGTRIYRARDGALVRMFAPPFSTGQFAYSLAISTSGAVALGCVGSVDFYSSVDARDPQRYYCAGSCGPVSAVMPARWMNAEVHELELVIRRATCTASAFSMIPKPSRQPVMA